MASSKALLGLIVAVAITTGTLAVPAKECRNFPFGSHIYTYDEGFSPFDAGHKYLLSSYPGATPADQCKFQVRMHTGESQVSTPVLEWIGIAFGVHQKNENKFELNMRVSRDPGVVELRGRGHDEPEPIGCADWATEPNPEEWIFDYDAGTSDSHHFVLSVPELGCEVIIEYTESDTSPDLDTVVITTASHHGQLLGLCGNADGDSSNDGDFCPQDTGNVAFDCIDSN